jgi:hypothetical protein
MTATYDDDPTDDPWKSPAGDDLYLDTPDGDEVKIAKVDGRVNDYVAVKLNGGVKDNVKRGLGHELNRFRTQWLTLI